MSKNQSVDWGLVTTSDLSFDCEPNDIFTSIFYLRWQVEIRVNAEQIMLISAQKTQQISSHQDHMC